MKKLFILDTCVLLNDPDSLFKMGDHDVGLCPEVLNELDRIKDSGKGASYEARQVIRVLHEFLGSVSVSEFLKGVPLGKDLGSLRVINDLDDSGLTGDNAIIQTVLNTQDSSEYSAVVLVTRDMNMNLRAKMSGVILVEDYKSEHSVKTEALDDTGFIELQRSVWDYFSDVQSSGRSYVCTLKSEVISSQLVPNRFICEDSKLYKVISLDGLELVLELVVKKDLFGLSPQNDRQVAGVDLLTDENVGLVTLTGAAGCGKTLLAVAAGIEGVIEKKLYDRVIIVRNTPPIAEETGFLPGSEEDKIMPFLQGVMDAMTVLGAENNKDTISYLIEAAAIEFKSINTMRGASCYRTFMVIEEAQNTTINALKALITRVGQGSKVVITGNLNSSQIDASYVTPWSNGLIRAVEVFTGHENGGHIQLQGVLRGDIASHAEEYM